MELLIVIIILGMLAALVLPGLMETKEKAEVDLVCSQMASVESALDMFKLDNGTYPQTEEKLQALITNPDPEKYQGYKKNGYFKNGAMPTDSWKQEFVYIYDEESGIFELVSFGTDRKEGGKDYASDILFSGCHGKKKNKEDIEE